MAKVIKGARRGRDPVMRYGSYKDPTSGKVIRRAMHPEYYMHSWSRQVRENRKLFAQVMENYSKMDIVTKQAYTEAIWLRPPVPIPPQVREKLSDLWHRARRRIHTTPQPLPSYVPLPWTIPVPWPVPNPYISPWVWPWPEYQPWPRQQSVGGHQEAIRQGMGYGQQRDPTRNPLPGEIPLPGPEPNEDRNPPRNPVIITLEIEPGGWLGKSWELYVKVHSEYTRVERWITSHKKEVIIIVAFGTLILLTFSLVVGGLELQAGSRLLVTPAAEKFYPLGALMLPNVDIKKIKDSYYEKIIIETLKNLNIWAMNYTRGWICYTETTTDEYGATIDIYEGPTAGTKGDKAADVSIFFDWDKNEATIIPHCYGSEDTIIIYNGDRQLFWCGTIEPRLAPPWLYNYTQKCYGEYKYEIRHGEILFAFEDRPVWGDGDFNDAYFKLLIDQNWNIIGWEAIEGRHCDEIGVFWLGVEWGHFPKRC